MKIFTTEQIRQWDAYTIRYEPITPLDLMERASRNIAAWIHERFNLSHPVTVFCGPGNNGGDGLAVARLLSRYGFSVRTYIIEAASCSADFLINEKRLRGVDTPEKFTEETRVLFRPNEIVIDALFGSGLNRPLDGLFGKATDQINAARAIVVAIDTPSGLFGEKCDSNSTKVRADYTLALQSPKLSHLLPANDAFVGQLYILDIGLSVDFQQAEFSDIHYLTEDWIRARLKKRSRYSHKGTYGKALIIAGSKGSIGAAVLTSTACYRAGTGLVYAALPACGTQIMQIALPEAIVLEDPADDSHSVLPDTGPFEAIGVGPGIRENDTSVKLLEELFQKYKGGLVIDASALNLIAQNRRLLDKIPEGAVLTPHPKEFERLVGESRNDYERLEKLKELSTRIRGTVVLKGARTVVATSEELLINSTGNPGMATGGSGDALTGIITGLIAQGYAPRIAAAVGVFLHGYAGDSASKRTGLAPLLATDIIEGMKDSFLAFES